MPRTPWRHRLPAALAVPASVLALTAAVPAPGPAAAMPPAARDLDPGCTGPTGPAVPVAGGTVSWCPTQQGGRLVFTNTGRAYADLSLVVYDCDGGKAPNVDAAKCAGSLKGTSDIIWRQIKSKQSVHADFAIPRGANAQVWWTADGTDQATDLKLLGTPWNS
ncbi:MULTISPECIES: hypothetical protein [Kitasatospora]|uniref:Uncharacterized protein n=1 Tax=Kitasatospora setae (strain ATCC 33774 / DSM 43861 / JCM 3304 / KCC A-0304 / NBRC 14216 / KM-6054) TaxID=452652 RepID=E4N466_KITSK|nr:MULTISPECIES: hypothetical protein [Kitasatospora]BAJ25997.1 hypothetical protein KSE_01460 [Kitasatospora setae KM-6054]